jgi:hypothetical protein
LKELFTRLVFNILRGKIDYHVRNMRPSGMARTDPDACLGHLPGRSGSRQRSNAGDVDFG